MLFSLQQLSILDVFSLEMCAFIGEQLEEKNICEENTQEFPNNMMPKK